MMGGYDHEVGISIHALREEGDMAYNYLAKTEKEFLSTPSARRATQLLPGHARRGSISIHALREEGDWMLGDNFIDLTAFLSTPSARRATVCPACVCWFLGYFYPRPPRGGRRFQRSDGAVVVLFLSTPSARRATTQCWIDNEKITISIHALREEGDRWTPCPPRPA